MVLYLTIYSLFLNQILQCESNDISVNCVIHIYFHKIGSPLQKMTNGDHFGYLEPISEPHLCLRINTI